MVGWCGSVVGRRGLPFVVDSIQTGQGSIGWVVVLVLLWVMGWHGVHRACLVWDRLMYMVWWFIVLLWDRGGAVVGWWGGVRVVVGLG